MLNKKCKSVFVILVISLLSACMGGGGTKPIHYYLIDPTDYANNAVKAVRDLKIAIIDLHIPQYLERFHIAKRSHVSQLEFSENNQWGESLRKNLLRTMARNLSFLLSTDDVGTPLNRSLSSPDYSLQIFIEQFELDSDNLVKLVARWQLSGPSRSEPLDVFSAEIQNTQLIEEGNYDQMVSVMRDMFGDLSVRIADSIVAQEN